MAEEKRRVRRRAFMQYELYLGPKVREALREHNSRWHVWLHPRFGSDPYNLLWVNIDPDEDCLTVKRKKNIGVQAKRIISKAIESVVPDEFKKCFTVSVYDRML